MKIYTKTGDAGETGLFGGGRVPKDDSRVEAFGTVDELNAAIGLARSEALPAAVEGCLLRVQHELFALGAELATRDPQRHGTQLIAARQISALEREIDTLECDLPALQQFILPAGGRSVVLLHMARAVCRRAERRVVSLGLTDENLSPHLVPYLNRLGDYLFVAARFANHAAQAPEVTWQKIDR